MKMQGEFEQRAEVRPVEQVPLPKAKPSPALKIICILLALAVLGMGGYIVYDKLVAEKATECPCRQSF